MNINIESNDLSELFIDEIEKLNIRVSQNGRVLLYDFKIILNVGEITFTSTGFKQDFADEFQLGEGQTYNRK